MVEMNIDWAASDALKAAPADVESAKKALLIAADYT
jgi:hypothetical protein